MTKAVSITITLLITLVGLLLYFSGVHLLAVVIAVSCLTLLFYWFTKKPKPEEEMPSGSVSCCHYLGDNDDDTHR